MLPRLFVFESLALFTEAAVTRSLLTYYSSSPLPSASSQFCIFHLLSIYRTSTRSDWSGRSKRKTSSTPSDRWHPERSDSRTRRGRPSRCTPLRSTRCERRVLHAGALRTAYTGLRVFWEGTQNPKSKKKTLSCMVRVYMVLCISLPPQYYDVFWRGGGDKRNPLPVQQQ